MAFVSRASLDRIERDVGGRLYSGARISHDQAFNGSATLQRRYTHGLSADAPGSMRMHLLR
jgi:hypothetical protein